MEYNINSILKRKEVKKMAKLAREENSSGWVEVNRDNSQINVYLGEKGGRGSHCHIGIDASTGQRIFERHRGQCDEFNPKLSGGK